MKRKQRLKLSIIICVMFAVSLVVVLEMEKEKASPNTQATKITLENDFDEYENEWLEDEYMFGVKTNCE